MIDPNAMELAGRVLGDFLARPEGAACDWGIAALLRLLSSGDRGPGPLPMSAPEMAVVWAKTQQAGLAHPGLIGDGLAGLAVGLGHASTVEPRLAVVMEAARSRLLRWCERSEPPRQIRSVDYDIVGGMAGVVLALACLPDSDPVHLRPGLEYLLRLAAEPELGGFRHAAHELDSAQRWCAGRINYGLAHGVPGVLAAMVVSSRILPEAEHDRLLPAIRTIAYHLRDVSTCDDQGRVSWPPASGLTPSAQPHRHGWCYGTPAIALQISEAGRVLDDAELRGFADASMATFCDSWDGSALARVTPTHARTAVCHGLAGVVAVAEAFAPRVDSARGLVERLRRALTDEMARCADMAQYEHNDLRLTLLDGVVGSLCVLLGPTDDLAGREWLAPLALR